MKVITAKILDRTHLELSQPLSDLVGEYIQISVPDLNEEEELWKKLGKNYLLEAYAPEDAIYDEI